MEVYGYEAEKDEPGHLSERRAGKSKIDERTGGKAKLVRGRILLYIAMNRERERERERSWKQREIVFVYFDNVVRGSNQFATTFAKINRSG